MHAGAAQREGNTQSLPLTVGARHGHNGPCQQRTAERPRKRADCFVSTHGRKQSRGGKDGKPEGQRQPQWARQHGSCQQGDGQAERNDRPQQRGQRAQQGRIGDVAGAEHQTQQARSGEGRAVQAASRA